MFVFISRQIYIQNNEINKFFLRLIQNWFPNLYPTNSFTRFSIFFGIHTHKIWCLHNYDKCHNLITPSSWTKLNTPMNPKQFVRISNIIGILSIVFLTYWIFTFVTIEFFGLKIFRQNLTEIFYLSVTGILALLVCALIVNLSLIHISEPTRPL